MCNIHYYKNYNLFSIFYAKEQQMFIMVCPFPSPSLPLPHLIHAPPGGGAPDALFSGAVPACGIGRARGATRPRHTRRAPGQLHII